MQRGKHLSFLIGNVVTRQSNSGQRDGCRKWALTPLTHIMVLPGFSLIFLGSPPLSLWPTGLSDQSELPRPLVLWFLEQSFLDSSQFLVSYKRYYPFFWSLGLFVLVDLREAGCGRWPGRSFIVLKNERIKSSKTSNYDDPPFCLQR